MTPQQVFDKVATHLVTQNAKALIPDSPDQMCAYHAADGAKCAAGCLIPNDLYHPDMEAKAIDLVFRRWPAVAEHIGIENSSLLQSLQKLHDHNEPEYWAAELRYLADDWNLSAAAINSPEA